MTDPDIQRAFWERVMLLAVAHDRAKQGPSIEEQQQAMEERAKVYLKTKAKVEEVLDRPVFCPHCKEQLGVTE